MIQAFDDIELFFKYWTYTEGLAEFYLSLVGFENGSFQEFTDVVGYYKKIYAENNRLSALELFRMAIAEFESESALPRQ